MSQINWEKALRAKLTFVYKGVCKLEDLWHLDSFTGKRLIEINNPCFKRLSELHPEQQKNIGRTTTSGPLGYSRYEMIQPYYFRLITRFNFTEFNINSLEEVVILMPVLHNSNLYYLLINEQN